ncbi:hypothetical protein L915_07530 [Phytophthora nicotianae]|uniref:Uncharacterized protein n=1 Tax=Phytophthora nicotianae TaxID=4792 RepID=W2GYY5_PHYNI|nr:hypothetical protein L915_07530 [Phytophthora nicotianae]
MTSSPKPPWNCMILKNSLLAFNIPTSTTMQIFRKCMAFRTLI